MKIKYCLLYNLLIINSFFTPLMAAERVTLPTFDEAGINNTCDAAIAKAKQQAAQIETVPLKEVTVANTLNAWNDLQITIEDAVGPIDLMSNVHPDEKVRTAGEACLTKATAYSTDLYQNAKLYQRIKQVKPETPAQTKLKKDLLEGFEDTGVALPAKKRARLKAIVEKIEALRQEFDRNVRDDKTKLTFTPEEVRGAPAGLLEKQPKDDKGNYLFGFDYPEYGPFMSNVDNEAARERYYRAFTNRGGSRNSLLLDQVESLRKEMAQLFGMPSYAEYVTRRKMVENSRTVDKFLTDVKTAVREVEKKELAALREFKAQTVGKKLEEVSIKRWDVRGAGAPSGYWQEKYRQAKFNIDQEALRKNFQSDASAEFSLEVASQLYGVKFQKAEVPAWHPDVRYYDVMDAATGQYLSGIYLDLYPREGKYKHAAAWGVRSVSRVAGRTPVSVLVTNFDRTGLTHEELETMLHEFGHVLHGVLSTTDYLSHGGTNVLNDFVEAPSQMFEEWARKPESLALFQKVCAACTPLDAETIKRIDGARKFGAGIQYSRQHLYASFDMALTGMRPAKALATWNKMEGETPLGHVAGTEFPNSFAHLIGGYGAGYYGYMWSEVLALDMLSAFGDNIMNPQVGRRFRDTILGNGGQETPKQLVERFLGRPTNSKAFFAEITGQR